jgi:hypothetical protein
LAKKRVFSAEELRQHKNAYDRRMWATDQDNRQRRIERHKKWMEDNPDYYREWQERNRKKCNEGSRRYKIRHKWEIRQREINDKRNNPIKYWAKWAIRHHRAVGYTVTITRDELVNICMSIRECIICGTKLSWNHLVNGTGRTRVTPSLDRIDNEMSITKDNIQIICLGCNSTKGNRTMSEFIEYCNNVVLKFGRPPILPTIQNG